METTAELRALEDRFAGFAERTGQKYAALHDATRELISAYMADEDLGPHINRLEDLTGGQQNGS